MLPTSRTPYQLAGLRPEQVQCMTTDPEGYAVVDKLRDHPEFATWQDEMAQDETVRKNEQLKNRISLNGPMVTPRSITGFLTTFRSVRVVELHAARMAGVL